MKMINLTIDGKQVQVAEGSTILQAAQQAGINIPTLCYLPGINELGACRVCVVEVEGRRNLPAACVTPVEEGMVVKTNSRRVLEARRVNVELLLSDHPWDCLTCERNTNCELQALAQNMGIREIRFAGERNEIPVDCSSPSIKRDPSKCVNCRRCVAVCSVVQSVNALGAVERGFKTVIAPMQQKALADVPCVNCGQCALVCPTGALTEVAHIDAVWDALSDESKHVIVQTAPAVRVAIGEEFGLEPGTPVEGKLVAGLRRLGFARVFDTNFAADLTIMEEAHELLHRLTDGGVLPQITSCSPGWIKFIEHNYPEELDHLSTCKSPQQMFGALAKTYYAEKEGIDPDDIFVVSVMPCTAKKFEIERPTMDSSGRQDVDAVLTTRELAAMFKEAGINLPVLPDEEYDAPLGIATGAGAIFGATGGVMEAALRTAYEKLTGETLPKLEFTEVRGMEGIKHASFVIGGQTVKVAVAHGLANARKLMDGLAAGEFDDYQFVEVMACPGGCIGGGGQPRPTDDEVRQKRIAGIYNVDEAKTIRKSHENPAVLEVYREYLGEPNSEKAHQLLHTHYVKRGNKPVK